MNLRSYLLPALLALILHSVILSALFYSWFGYAEDQRQLTPRHVKAQMVDLKTQVKASQQAKQAEAQKKKEARKKAEAKKIADAKKKAEAKKKLDAKKRADDKKKADAKKRADAKKKDALKKKETLKREAQKKEKARIAAEKKRQQEIKRKEQERQENARKEAERQQAEKERQETEQQEKAQREAELDAAMAEEEREMQAEQDRQSVAGYRDYIAAEIEQSWRRPPSARNGMKVLLALHLLPTGEVDNVYVVTGSGNSHFDESAIRAVKRVGRFSKLQEMDPVLFDRYYRKFNLEFIPSDLRR